ncbi:MAG: S1 RNA-binding domain-containing protein, partial [Gammaproteobacteria bacterium]
AGLSETLAEHIVTHREQNGRFKNRRQLMDVPRLGPKAFEQAAGFLRITDGDNPLDASGVHPEAYPVVERILQKTQKSIENVIGATALLNNLVPEDFTDQQFGAPTVKDIIRELDKPGRDPRPEFKTAAFKEGVETLDDLEPGQVLEGVISNVTNFGAFVDIGVHQDGLVHISALANKFVQDPREIVKAGNVVKVKVLSVDTERKRIALSMRLSDEAERKPNDLRSGQSTERRSRDDDHRPKKKSPQPATAMAHAFARLKDPK